jgi:hypothetical protein
VHEVVEVAVVRVEQHRDDRPSSSPRDADAEVDGRAGLAAPIDPESIQLGDLRYDQKLWIMEPVTLAAYPSA